MEEFDPSVPVIVKAYVPSAALEAVDFWDVLPHPANPASRHVRAKAIDRSKGIDRRFLLRRRGRPNTARKATVAANDTDPPTPGADITASWRRPCAP
jgi:hypothetical protein